MALGVLCFAAAVVVWLGGRIVPAWDVVFPEDREPVLLGNDPWFHLHQAEGAAEHFPRLIRWDVGTLYPKGSRVAASGLFDLAAAAAGKLTSFGDPTREHLIVILAWFPIILGLASLFCFYGLARDLFGSGFALLAVWIRVLFPGSELDRTLLGFADHHVAEIFLATLGLWLLVRYEKTLELTRKRTRFSLWLFSLPFGLFLFTWAGGPLQIGTLVVCFWCALAVSLLWGETDQEKLNRFLPYFASLLIFISAVGFVFSDLVMSPSGHFYTLVALGCQLLLMYVLGKLLPALIARFGRSGTVALLCASAAIVIFLFWRSAPRMDYFLDSFLSRRKLFVVEHQGGSLSTAKETWGVLLYWLPLAALTGFLKSTSLTSRILWLYIGLWTVLWLNSGDFRYLVSSLVPLAVVCGMRTFCQFWTRLAPPTSRFAWAVPLLTIAYAVSQIFVFSQVQAPFKTEQTTTDLNLATPPWQDAMKWLREQTPVPTDSPTTLASPWKNRRGFTYAEGSYGVLSHWHYGNILSTLGERLAVSARGRSGKFFDWFKHTDADASRKKLEDFGDVRYVVLDAESVCDFFPSEVQESGRRMNDFQVTDGVARLKKRERELLSYGSEFRTSVGARLFLGDGLGMGNYRLVFESEQPSFIRYRAHFGHTAVHLRSTLLLGQDELAEVQPYTEVGTSWKEPGGFFCYSGQITSTVKIFESVPGAKVSGLVKGSENVAIELEVLSPATGRSFLFRQSGEPDKDGLVTFTVPYPTGADHRGDFFRAKGPYRITTDGRRLGEVEVSESDVREGKTVRFELEESASGGR